MTVARGDNGKGGQLLLFGLEKENIERLMAGKPIRIRREVHGDGIPENLEIIICYGTGQEIYDQLKQAGVVDQETKIQVDPRLKPPNR